MPTNFDDLLEGDEGADLLQGLSGNDTLQGFSGNDLLYGGADNDSLLGDDGVDQLYGGSGLDTLHAGAGDDRVEGGSGDDQLYGEGGNDSLTGGDGNDTLDGGGGADTVFGGLGNDILSGNGTRLAGGLGDDTINAGQGDAWITGDDGNDFVFASGGSIDGGIGDDLLLYTAGNTYGSAATTVIGGAGDDTLIGYFLGQADCGEGNDVVAVQKNITAQYFTDDWMGVIEGGSGHDILYLDSTYETGDPESENFVPLDFSRITGFEEIVLRSQIEDIVPELVILTDANIGDTGAFLVRSAGREQPSDDLSLYGIGQVGDFLVNFFVDGSAVTTGHLTLIGGGNHRGGALSDTISGSGNLFGNGGDDVISGTANLYGGDGNDSLTDTGGGPGILDGGTGDDSIAGGVFNDTILGGDGNDSINAGNGANSITGGLGDDTIHAGTDTDTVIYAGVMADYTITQNIDHLSVTGPEGTDLLYGINFIAFADQIYEVPIPGVIRIGSGDPDYIDGSDGSDSLAGGAGNDTLLGGIGNDTLVGGAGFDSLDGGTGIDTASYGDAESGVSVNLGSGTATGGEAPVAAPDALTADAVFAGDRLRGIDNVVGSQFDDSLLGSLGDNTLSGGAGNDALNGGRGNDSLLGDAGADSLVGGLGADTLEGGEGADRMLGGAGSDLYLVNIRGDVVSEALTFRDPTDAGGIDTVISLVSFSLAATAGVGFVENLILAGTANTRATGNDLGNSLTGNAGRNAISGGLGDDTISGGAGNDVLTGGAGSDSFIFTHAPGPGNRDRITDFDPTQDTIHLDSSVFSGLTAGGLSPTAFATNLDGRAADALNRIIYESDTGLLWYDSDGTGAAARVVFASLAVGLALSDLDFFVA